MPLRHWTRAEYERLVDAGLFREDPVELIGGQLVVAEPQGSYHATALGAFDDALRAVLPAGWTVRAQMLVALDDESAPEPDLCVVSGRRGDYRDSHPARPALVVEVADASLAFDRGPKASLDRVVEVYRRPEPDPSMPYGWRYGWKTTLTPASIVVPLALASVRIAVADLLP